MFAGLLLLTAAAAAYSCGDGLGAGGGPTDADNDRTDAGRTDGAGVAPPSDASGAAGADDGTAAGQDPGGETGGPDGVQGDDDGASPAAPTWTLPEVAAAERIAVTSERITNREATVPPMCYTKTAGRHNPCYVCHQMYDRRGEDRLNELDDGDLQGSYNFSDIGVDNHWDNLFVDRRAWVDSISDEDIRAYVDADNYSGLAPRLRTAEFGGFIPDLEGYAEGASAFDERGLARDGSHWVAFNYKPFPGAFWPTNGATDDVLVRLPRPFRQLKGEPNRDVYFVNLTLVELNIKRLQQATIWPVDEAALGTDVDGDGELGTATRVVASEHYVGDATDVALKFQQFPTGTELMHSVRYLGVDDAGRVHLPRRMKELRYMRKVSALDREVLSGRYAAERKEKRLGELPNKLFRGDLGFDNGLGWYVQGFVEDYDGELRPQSYEEGLFCMGCHGAIGTTIDSTFSFARKVTGAEGWGYIDLVGMRDAPNVGGSEGEILDYLRRVGGGSEFRENPEMVDRWFGPDGQVNADEVAKSDVYTLLTPSAARALELDKAYTHIVRHQSFIDGRDPSVAPANNVHREVDESTPPLESAHRIYGWDIRLDWTATNANP
jgi:hypothetical protein